MTDNGIERKLGEVAGKLDMLIQHSAQSENRSSESRREMYRRTDDLSERLNAVEAKLASLHEDVVEMKPVVDAVKASKFKAVGAISVLSVVGSLIATPVVQYFSHVFGIK